MQGIIGFCEEISGFREIIENDKDAKCRFYSSESHIEYFNLANLKKITVTL